MGAVKVYCVEDEESIRELIAYVLEGQGYEVKTFPSAAPFWLMMEECLPDLVLLDIMLPDEDGKSILKKLRSQSRTEGLPVILLTARTSEFDVVQGLDAGADDYIKKPFSVVELMARVKSLLRRSGATSQVEKLLSHGVQLNKRKRKVKVEGEKIELTTKEFDVLAYLMENEDIVLSREQIMNVVWGFSFEGTTRTVDMHIATLRQKLGDAGQYIETSRGIGYRWRGMDEP